MNIENQVEKIVSSFKTFLNNSRQDVKTIKVSENVEFSSEELEEIFNEIVMEISNGNLAIYERNILNGYFTEFLIKTNKALFVFHLFFEKTAGKYKLYLIEMSKFFNEKI
ncbi:MULTISPECIES: hypothetical protein [Bacteria]|uniref:Uncharacterized protein n=1 Tax=Planomonospora alba TaxID=161354 RepID=A0ABP6NYN5_9ACTN|nr:hypothetical protein [Sulfolobus islandicus]